MKMAKKNKIKFDDDISVLEHLAELRKRIIIVVISIIVMTLIMYYYVPFLIDFIIKSINYLNIELVFFYITEAFTTRLKLGFISALIILSPLIMYHTASFIAPGLKKSEKNIVKKALILISVAFTSGFIFAFKFIIPFVLKILISIGNSYMTQILSAAKYLSFIAVFCTVVGFIFTLPIIIINLSKLGLLNYEILTKGRKFILFGVFVFEGVFLNSFNLIHVLIITLPLIILNEITIAIVRFFKKKI